MSSRAGTERTTMTSLPINGGGDAATPSSSISTISPPLSLDDGGSDEEKTHLRFALVSNAQRLQLQEWCGCLLHMLEKGS